MLTQIKASCCVVYDFLQLDILGQRPRDPLLRW